MIPSPLDRNDRRLKYGEIRFPDFEVSWAGENPWNGGYCFGTEDGKLIPTSIDSFRGLPPMLASDSGEAVNGVAFSRRVMMAVSTRSKVVFHEFNSPDLSDYKQFDFDGGAHGVISTTAGGFVAPLGIDGILSVDRSPGSNWSMRIFSSGNEKINFYNLVLLWGDGKKDVIVGAARDRGILSLVLAARDGRVTFESYRFFGMPGLDLVGVCSMSSPEWPNAAVGLGRDGSVHFCRDVLGDHPPHMFRFNKLQGAAYTILHHAGHLFILTNEALYTLPGLAARYLSGEFRGGRASVRESPLDAADIYLAHGRLLLVMADHVIDALVDDLVSEIDDASIGSLIQPTIDRIDAPWSVSSNLGWSHAVVDCV